MIYNGPSYKEDTHALRRFSQLMQIWWL